MSFIPFIILKDIIRTIDLRRLIDVPQIRNQLQPIRLTTAGPLACCPFHIDSDPSLAIYSNHFYCYGCQTYGDALDLLTKIFATDTQSALNLVEKLIIKRPHNLSGPSNQPTCEDSQGQRRGLLLAPAVSGFEVQIGNYDLYPTKYPSTSRYIYYTLMVNDKPHGKWQRIRDCSEERQRAIGRGAGFFTVLAMDEKLPPCWYFGPWYIDLDGPYANEELYLKLRRTYNLGAPHIKGFNSGKKGYHIEIDIGPCGSPWLPLIYAELTRQLKLESADMNIYSMGRGRMWRIPGIRRPNGEMKKRIF